MDMELSEQQRQLVDTARHFMENECPLAAVREQEATEAGFSIDLWRQMANLGWLGLPFPEEYGGYGLGNVDLALLSKEMGRALCPSPYIPSVVLAGGAILAAGSDEQKKEWLPRIASGQTVVAFAIQEASPYWDPRGVSCRATETADGWALNGTKMFVEFAGAADRVLVVARTSGEKPSREGITMFLVDSRASGVGMTALGTLARDKQFRVTLDGVAVSKDDVIGPVGGAWPLLEPVIQSGIVAFSAYNVGESVVIISFESVLGK
jgi:alkylation response protein AidB-like acyl-CoA dehydrogenase